MTIKTLKGKSTLVVLKIFYSWSKSFPHRCNNFILKEYHIFKVELFYILNYLSLNFRKHIIKIEDRHIDMIAINLMEHLGDIVACEPVVRYLKHKYPCSYLVWFVKKPYKELIDSNPFVDQTLVVQCWTEWERLAGSGVFDKVVNLHIEERFCRLCDRKNKKEVNCSEIISDNYYEYGCLLTSFSKKAGLPDLSEEPKVYIPKSAKNKINLLGLPDKYVVIHCSSNESCRDWITARWHELVKKVANELQIHVIEIGTNSKIGDISLKYFMNLCGKLSLLEAAEVIRRAKIFIGVDSGPAHLANAVGTYGVILLSKYRNFKRYMPYSGNYATGVNAQIIFGDDSVNDITVERVYDVVRYRFKTVEGKDVVQAPGVP